MNEPRPATISALPFESRSSVANSWNTRTGSAALRTVTALVSRIRRVRAAGGGGIQGGGGSRNRGSGENHGRRGIEELAPVVFANAKYIETDLVSERDCFKQLAETSRRIDG